METLTPTKSDLSGLVRFPTNKTQVYDEIIMVMSWLIIHVNKSLPILLVLYSYRIATFHDLEDSSSVRNG